MAEEIKVIRVGDILTNLIDPVTKLSVQYSKVLNWYDGTPMTDAKLDSYGIYVKKGSEYFLKSLGEYGQVLQKNTMTEMRNLSGLEILLLRMGYYNSVQLNGYYTEGDTPAPINYVISTTTEVDDGGSVVEVGAIKLEHDFGGVIDVRYYGAKGDGVFDSSTPIQNALNKTGTIQIIGGGKYMIRADKDNGLGQTNTRGLLVKSNTFIQSDKKTILKAIPNASTLYNVLALINCQNVSIKDLIIHGEKDEHLGTGGEWGYGISLRTAKDVVIDNVEVRDCWGDGVTLARFNIGQYCENIKITRLDVYGCRRQGLTINSVDGLFVSDSTFNNTRGTAPQFGIDIEPDTPQERIANVFLKNLTLTDNAAGGLLIALGLLDETSHPVSIDVDNIKVINTFGIEVSRGYIGVSMGSHGSYDNDIKGVIKLRNLDISNTLEAGLSVTNWVNMPDLYIDKVRVEGAGRGVVSVNDPKFSGIRVQNNKENARVIRRPIIDINNVEVIMLPHNNTLVRAGYFFDDSATEDNTFIRNLRVFNNPVNSTRFENRFANIVEVGVLNLIKLDSDLHPYYQAANTISTKLSTARRGIALYNTQNNTLTVINDGDFGVDLNLYNRIGSFLNIPNSNGRQLSSDLKGSTITVKRVDSNNNWRVISMTGTWQVRNFNNGDVLNVIGDSYYNMGDRRFRIVSNSTILQDKTPKATLTVEGGVKQAVAVPNGSSIDDLLAALRAAGILAT